MENYRAERSAKTNPIQTQSWNRGRTTLLRKSFRLRQGYAGQDEGQADDRQQLTSRDREGAVKRPDDSWPLQKGLSRVFKLDIVIYLCVV